MLLGGLVMEFNHKVIKFYTTKDLNVRHEIIKVKDFLKNFDSQIILKNINECLKLYNVQKFIKAGLLSSVCSESIEKLLEGKSNIICELIGRFLNKIDDSNILEHYDTIYREYEDDFWEIVCKNNLYLKISSEKLAELLSAHPSALDYILRHKKIVIHHGETISNQLELNLNTAERLISHFLKAKEYNQVDCYFPTEFNQKKRDNILWKYVSSDNANLNYLELLYHSQNSRDFPLSDRLRLEAKRKYEKKIDELFAKDEGISYITEIGFTSLPDYSIKESYIDRKHSVLYSSEWIKDNLDYPTLLNNFIFLFGYVDICFRCSFTSLPSKMGNFEDLLGIKGVKDYPKGIVFDMDCERTNQQMLCYKCELEKSGVRIEDIFKWFFEVYLYEEFNAEGFTYAPPSKYTTTVEKCKLLAISIDGVLKQYRLFLDDEFIDRELLEMSSEHVKFSEIKSMVKHKYAYSKSRELYDEQFMLYSNQSKIIYTEKTKELYNNLPALLLSEEMTKEDFYDYQQENLNWLINRGTIIQKSSGKLTINKNKAVVLEDLFINDVVCPNYYGRISNEIHNLVTSGDMEYEDTLFTRPEQAYLNYILNKAKYSNGLDLRNKYCHDTCSLKEEEHIRDYIELQKIMVLIIIKINEEFCLRELQRKS